MLESLIEWFENVHPIVFFIGLTLCPLLPIPVSPFWVLAGMRFGPVGAIVLSASALILNLGVAYLVSSRIFRSQIEWLLRRRNVRIPQVPKADQAKFTFLIRVVPGNPLFIQNYLLGFVRIGFATYFLSGLIVQMFYAVGFILFGEAVFEGRFGLMIFAVLLICSIVIAIKLLSKRLMSSKGCRSLLGLRNS